MMDMAEHPDGLDLSTEAALLVVCSTQVRMSATPGRKGAVDGLADAHCLLSTTRPPASPRAACQGDGVPPSEARDFCDWLASPVAPRMERTHFSVCALGDTCAPRAALRPVHRGMQRPCPRAQHLPVAYPNNCARSGMCTPRVPQRATCPCSGRACAPASAPTTGTSARPGGGRAGRTRTSARAARRSTRG